jgi:hypothetical protein
VAAAQARLATQRRLHEQQRSSALLQRAWQQLPAELQARWQDTPARAAWVAQVLASARERLPHAAWRIVHAPDWPVDEQQALATTLEPELGAVPVFEADATLTAGLKVIVHGNVIDGTLAGLLADRSALAAQLLRRLETAA